MPKNTPCKDVEARISDLRAELVGVVEKYVKALKSPDKLREMNLKDIASALGSVVGRIGKLDPEKKREDIFDLPSLIEAAWEERRREAE